MVNKRIRLTCVLSAFIVAAVVSVPAARTSVDGPHPTIGPHSRGRLGAASLQLPMRFEPSPDRAAVAADFIARGPNYAMYLSGAESRLLLVPPSGSATPPTTISMRLVGADPHIAAPTGLEPHQELRTI